MDGTVLLGTPPTQKCGSGAVPACTPGYTFEAASGRCLPTAANGGCAAGTTFLFAGPLGPGYCVSNCAAGLNLW